MYFTRNELLHLKKNKINGCIVVAFWPDSTLAWRDPTFYSSPRKQRMSDAIVSVVERNETAALKWSLSQYNISNVPGNSRKHSGTNSHSVTKWDLENLHSIEEAVRKRTHFRRKFLINVLEWWSGGVLVGSFYGMVEKKIPFALNVCNKVFWGLLLFSEIVCCSPEAIYLHAEKPERCEYQKRIYKRVLKHWPNSHRKYFFYLISFWFG